MYGLLHKSIATYLKQFRQEEIMHLECINARTIQNRNMLGLRSNSLIKCDINNVILEFLLNEHF